mmetsp:Transcript_37675/g.47499  ORF Transcript_37675/g.47499 Transcript_37675/m.47499 type:complete len:182 (+) Transcript_37675:193-738(+)
MEICRDFILCFLCIFTLSKQIDALVGEASITATTPDGSTSYWPGDSVGVSWTITGELRSPYLIIGLAHVNPEGKDIWSQDFTYDILAADGTIAITLSPALEIDDDYFFMIFDAEDYRIFGASEKFNIGITDTETDTDVSTDSTTDTGKISVTDTDSASICTAHGFVSLFLLCYSLYFNTLS